MAKCTVAYNENSFIGIAPNAHKTAAVRVDGLVTGNRAWKNYFILQSIT